MGKFKQNNKLNKICRHCYYRRCVVNDTFYQGKSKLNSCCAYIIIEGEPRGCTPSEGECKRFKPRIKFDSTWGKHETIK